MTSIREELLDIESNSIVLFIPSLTGYHQSITDILDFLVNEGEMECIYVTTSRSYKRLTDLFSRRGIDTERMFFVDAVSKGIGFDTSGGDFSFLSDPRNLSSLSIIISKAVKKLEGKKIFLLFDSLSGLSLYNSIPHISKFFHALTAEIRSMGIGAVVISLNEEFKEELVSTFSGFCDKTIRIA